MAIIKCKMCGGDIEMAADKTYGMCEFCGSTMTLPKIDDDQRAAAFNRGNHFRRIGEFDKALSVYERIVAEDNTDAEAHWCCALCRFGIEYVEDPASFEWVPTCHRASFDSFLEDVDYLAAVEYSEGVTKRQYQKDAARIAEVQRGILATSQNSEPYDVFICYKESDENGDRTRDSQLAQDIYYQLKEQGRKVFFARITLEDVVGTQYEPYIFAALNSAKVMVVVGTKAEYLNAVWVKNEWSRFLAMMKKDRSKLLLPCYRDMDPYDLPEQLSVLQSYDMSKIGFIQDLIRGIAKVLDADKKPEPVKETVVVQQTASNYAALLKRGNMALSDGDWAQADEFFEEVLNQDAECAEAYIGKFLASKKQPTLKAQIAQTLRMTEQGKTETRTALPRDEKRENEILLARVVPNYLSVQEMKPLLSFDRNYTSVLANRQTQAKASGELFNRDKYLTKAMSFASGATLRELEEARDYLTESMEQRVKEAQAKDEAAIRRITEGYEKKLEEVAVQADKKRQEAEERREEDYQKQLEVLVEEYTVQAEEIRNKPRINDLTGAKLFFESNKEYKDCAEQAKQAGKMLADLKAEQKRLADEKAAKEAEEAERRRIEEEKWAAANKKKTIVISSVVAAVVVFLVLLVTVIIPSIKYSKAERMMEAGQYEEAMFAFIEIRNFRNAWERQGEAFMAMQEDFRAQADQYLADGDFVNAAIYYQKAGDNHAAAEAFDINSKFYVGEYVTAAVDKDGNLRYNSNHKYDDPEDVSADLAGITKFLEYDRYDGVNGLDENGKILIHDLSTFNAFNVTEDTGAFRQSGVVDIRDASSNKINGEYVSYVIMLKEDGTVVLAAEGNYNFYPAIKQWENIVQITQANGDEVIGVDADGNVHVALYFNEEDSFVIGDWPPIEKLLYASFGKMYALTKDGRVVTYGEVSENVQEMAERENIADVVGDFLLYKDGTVEYIYMPSQDEDEYDRKNTDSRNQSISDQVDQWYGVTQLAVQGKYLFGLTYDGSVLCLERSKSYSQDLMEEVVSWSDIVEIKVWGDENYTYAVGVKSDGSLVASGDGTYYQSEKSGDNYVDRRKDGGTYHLVDGWKLW